MPNPRHHVTGPSILPAPFGLLSVAEVRDEPEPRWRNGITFPSSCDGQATPTVDACVGDLDEAPEEAPPKLSVGGVEDREGPAVTLYAVHECSPVGETDEEADEQARALLASDESVALETLVLTGRTDRGTLDHAFRLNGDDTVQIPQPPAGQTAGLSLASLDAAISSRGRGVIYVPRALASLLVAEGHLIRNGSRLETALGTPVAAVAYDFDTFEFRGQTAANGKAWMFATGPVVIYRGGVTVLPGFDHSVNTRTMIAERTYAYAWECGVWSAAVNLATLEPEIGPQPDPDPDPEA